MNYQVSGSQVCEGVQLLPVGGGFLGGRCLPPGSGFGNELALRQYRQLGQRIFHAVGQGAVGEQDLFRLWQGAQRDGEKGGKSLFPEHLLHELCPVPCAAEHQGAELHLLVMAHVAYGGIQVAAVAGQLLGGNGQKLAGGIFLRVGAAAEGIEIGGRFSPEPLGKVLPLNDEVAELSRYLAAV